MDDEEEEDITGIENKIILLGDIGVGKTCLIKISVGENFDQKYQPTISFSFSSKEITYNEKTYKFNLWDTIGQEQFRSITKAFYKNAKIVIFVYDITNKESFESLEFWINSVNEELKDKNYIKAIIGNKKDLFLKEEVKEEEAEIYANSKGAKFKLCSAKDDAPNFVKFLEELCIECLKSIEEQDEEKDKEQSNVKLSKKKLKKRKCGC